MYSTAGMHDKRCKYPCTFSSRNIASSFELFKVWELEGNEKLLPTLSCLLFPLVLYFWMFRSHLNHMDWAVTSNSLRSTTFIRNWFGWTVHLTTLTAWLLMGWGAPRVAPPAAAVRAASRYPDRGRKDRWVWRLLRVPRGRPFPSSPLLASWYETSFFFRVNIYCWNYKEKVWRERFTELRGLVTSPFALPLVSTLEIGSPALLFLTTSGHC